MKNSVQILWLILKREILPAGEGKGLLQYIFYRIPMFYLPIIGIGLLLVIVSYTGLCLVGAEQNVENQINGFKTNPFTALYGKNPGSFYIKACERQDKNFYNLTCWQNVFSHEVKGLSDFPSQTPLFSRIKPISWVDLKVEMKNKNHLPYQRGLGLTIYGEYADQPFIQKIKADIIKGNKDEIEEGIVVSLKGLDAFGWRHYDEYPDFLLVKLHNDEIEDNEKYIPLRVFVVEQLPYQFLYLLSMNQLQLLETKYYERKIEGFEVIFLNGGGVQSKLIEIQKAMPVKSEILTTLIDGKEGARIMLDKPFSRIDIMNRLYKAKLYDRNVKLLMGDNNERLPVSYQGAIFHLNFQLPTNITWAKKHIYAIQNFMEKKGITIEGELIEILSEMMDIQNNFRSLKKLFFGLLLCMFFILLLFCGVVLHTRIYRIGIKLMIGTLDWVIVTTYFFLSIFLITFSFAFAVGIAKVFIPMDLSLSLWSSSVIKLYGLLLLITIISFTAPIKFFLHFYQPTEMISYRA